MHFNCMMAGCTLLCYDAIFLNILSKKTTTTQKQPTAAFFSLLLREPDPHRKAPAPGRAHAPQGVLAERSV